MPGNGNKGGNTNGTDDDDVIEASSSKINGGDGNDTITGTDAADRINAGDGDDVINGGAGDDTIYGNDGADTAVFSGDVRDYSFADGKGNATIVSGDDGTDTLKHINTLIFDNFAVLLDGTNNGPLVEDAALTVSEDGSADLDLLADAWDFEGDDITVTSASAGSVDGSVFTFDAAGAFDYLSAGESETVMVDFTATDGTTEVTRTIAVTVEGVNDDPDAVDDDGVVGEDDAPLAGNVLANDMDVDQSDTLTVSSIEGADVGTTITLESGAVVVMQSDGSYTYDPAGAFDDLNDGETATDSFSYTVSDGNGGSDTATVEITITGADDGFEISTGPIDLGAENPESVDYLYYEYFYGDDTDNEFAFDVANYIYGTRAYTNGGDDIVQLRSFAETGYSGYVYNNWIYGGDGNDALGLQAGYDEYGYAYYNGLSGDAGDDLLVLQTNGSEVGYAYYNFIYGGDGDDTGYIQVNSVGDDDGSWGYSYTYYNWIYGGNGDDEFTIQQNSVNMDDAGIYYGGLVGDAGNDVLTVDNNAQDSYYAGTNSQYLYGGTGNDTLTIDASDVSGAQYTAQVNSNYLYGQDDDDSLTITGSTEAGSQYAVQYNYLFGGNGNDTLIIETDNASSGGNRLYGDAGDDTLQSGAGNDYMWGGTGADTFAFADGFGTDTVYDYEDGVDQIDVSGIAGVDDYDDLTITQDGTSTTVSFGGTDTIVLTNVSAASIEADDFIF